MALATLESNSLEKTKKRKTPMKINRGAATPNWEAWDNRWPKKI